MAARRRARFSTARDRGTAALEFALFFGVFFGLVALCAPLGQALLMKTRLERVAGQAARFATQVPDRARPGSLGRKPSDAEIQAEAVTAANSVGIGTSTGWTTAIVVRTSATGAPGSTVTVTLHKTVDLGVFGAILSVINRGPTSNITLTASAVGRQE